MDETTSSAAAPERSESPGGGWWRPAEAIVRLEGGDAWSWLQGMVPTDVGAIEPGRAARSALLRRTGQLRALLRIVRTPAGEGPLLLLEARRIEELLDDLDAHIVMEDVALRRLPELGVLAVHVPASPPHGGRLELPDGVLVLRSARLGPHDIDLLGPPEALAQVREWLEARGFAALDAVALDRLRIGAPDPWLGRDVTGQELPLEAGLRPCISFSKGCYTGQEAVNKMAHRGKPRRLLVRLRGTGAADTEALPTEGAPLHAEAAGRPVGRLGTVVREVDGALLALAVVRREVAVPGTRLHTGGGRDAEAAAFEVLEAVDALP